MDEYNPDHFITPRKSGLTRADFDHVPPWRRRARIAVPVLLGLLLGVIIGMYVWIGA